MVVVKCIVQRCHLRKRRRGSIPASPALASAATAALVAATVAEPACPVATLKISIVLGNKCSLRCMVYHFITHVCVKKR